MKKVLMTDSKDSIISREYAEDWIQKSGAPGKTATLHPDDQYEQGLASCLYLGCINILKFICGSASKTSSGDDHVTVELKELREELGKLFLWGESLSDGSLDKALDQSDELRITVLTLLRDVADRLLVGKVLEVSFIWDDRTFAK